MPATVCFTSATASSTCRTFAFATTPTSSTSWTRFCDLSAAYVGATAYEETIWIARENSTGAGEQPDHEAIDAQLRDVMASMAEKFPFMARYAAEMTAGDGEDRFEFGVDVLVNGLTAVSKKYG